MFSQVLIKENRDEATVKSLLIAFKSIGESGIIKEHQALLHTQLVQGRYDEEDESLVRKIKDTRLKVNMLESLQYFCDNIEIEE